MRRCAVSCRYSVLRKIASESPNSSISRSGRPSENNFRSRMNEFARNPPWFQWALRAIASKSASRVDIMQALKSSFTELKTADDDAITDFVKVHAGN